MAISFIDTDSTSTYWTQITTIDGRDYSLTFRWNDRAQAWYLDGADQNGDPIFYGVRLVCGVILADAVIDDRMWPGDLFCFSSNDDDSDPGLNDLNQRVFIAYDDLQ